MTQDRRETIIEAGLAILREHGFNGFTQPRVAARAGLRQSHLTYYYPTRLDLLSAVGQAALHRQLAAVDAALSGLTTSEAAAQAIAALVTRHENTRVLLALAQAGDEAPELRTIFRDLVDGIVARLGPFLGRLRASRAPETSARLLHALAVGLAVVDLATDRPDGRQRAASLIAVALRLLVDDAASGDA